MSIEIKYTDEYGGNISSQQQSNFGRYNKLTISSGNIKMIESFKQSRGINYKTINYFLDPNENKVDILQQYSDPLNNARCIIYSNKQSANTINLWDFEEYSKDTILLFKGKQAFDSVNRIIFACTFDLLTNELQNGAIKHFYNIPSENPSNGLLLQFTYDSNGNIDWIIDIKEKFGYIKGISLDEYLADTEFSQVDFPWNQHPYYHAVTPYLPIGDL